MCALPSSLDARERENFFFPVSLKNLLRNGPRAHDTTSSRIKAPGCDPLDVPVLFSSSDMKKRRGEKRKESMTSHCHHRHPLFEVVRERLDRARQIAPPKRVESGECTRRNAAKGDESRSLGNKVWSWTKRQAGRHQSRRG